MAFDPLKWLGTIETLRASGDEAALRTAIGRAYYSMFLRNRMALAAAGIETFDGNANDHKRVSRALKTNLRPQSGLAHDQLYRLREKADYEAEQTVGVADLESALQKVQIIRRECDSDWSRNPVN